MEDSTGKVKRMRESNDEKGRDSSVKRFKKPKRLEFVGWGSKKLIEFLESLGRDTTNRISEYDVALIIRDYIRGLESENCSNKKTKTVVCDERLSALFGCKKIMKIKVADLVEKHYVENQDDTEFDFLYSSEDDKQKGLCLLDNVDKQTKVVVKKPKGTVAAIVSDNVKLLYLRKILVQELAKSPENFESKVVGSFVRIKNPYQLVHELPYQLVQVTGVKEGSPIDGYFLQVTNYSYTLKDALVATLSDDDFSKEECEELHQRIKNGCAKRLTVADMEEKVRSLHEDLTKHWLARELVRLQRQIDWANEKGWRRELSQYLEKRELLKAPEEQSSLLRTVPEVVAEELEPECLDNDWEVENDFTEANPEAFLEAHRSYKEKQTSELEPVASLESHLSDKEQKLSDSPVYSIQETPKTTKLRDEEEQPAWIAYAGDKDLHEDVFKPQENVITHDKDSEPPATPENVITQNKDSEPPAKGITQNKDSEPPENVIIHIIDSEPPANGITQNINSEPPLNVITQDKDSEPPATPENVITQNKDSEPPAKGITQNKDFKPPPANDTPQNKDSKPPANVITQKIPSITKIEIVDLENEPQAQPNPIEIIELSDDDEEENENPAIKEYDPEKLMWYYEFPKGKTHGPFSLTSLKLWNDEKYFVGIPDFKVWTRGESAVSLTKLLPLIKA